MSPEPKRPRYWRRGQEAGRPPCASRDRTGSCRSDGPCAMSSRRRPARVEPEAVLQADSDATRAAMSTGRPTGPDAPPVLLRLDHQGQGSTSAVLRSTGSSVGHSGPPYPAAVLRRPGDGKPALRRRTFASAGGSRLGRRPTAGRRGAGRIGYEPSEKTFCTPDTWPRHGKSSAASRSIRQHGQANQLDFRCIGNQHSCAHKQNRRPPELSLSYVSEGWLGRITSCAPEPFLMGAYTLKNSLRLGAFSRDGFAHRIRGGRREDDGRGLPLEWHRAPRT